MKVRNSLLLCLFLGNSSMLSAQNGQDLFQNNCASCHTIGKGRLVGPDLKGIYKTRSEKKLISWIKSSESVIKSGDTSAVNLFAKFNEIIMPDQDLTDAEIMSILVYIKAESENETAAVSSPQQTSSSNAPTNAATNSNTTQKPGTDSDNSSYSSTFLNYLGFGIAAFFLLIIWMCARVINTLSAKLRAEYRKNDH